MRQTPSALGRLINLLEDHYVDLTLFGCVMAGLGLCALVLP